MAAVPFPSCFAFPPSIQPQFLPLILLFSNDPAVPSNAVFFLSSLLPFIDSHRSFPSYFHPLVLSSIRPAILLFNFFVLSLNPILLPNTLTSQPCLSALSSFTDFVCSSTFLPSVLSRLCSTHPWRKRRRRISTLLRFFQTWELCPCFIQSVL